MECVWDINVQEGYYVVFNFILLFDMEVYGVCGYDYVEVSLQLGSMLDRVCWLVFSGRFLVCKNVMYFLNFINEIIYVYLCIL